MHLIRRGFSTNLMDNVKSALNTVKGGFAYLLMTDDKIIAALDPNGFRPLSIGKLTNGAYVIASETCALDVVGATFVQDVLPGQVVTIDAKGVHVDTYTTDVDMKICSMEFIYFARPDSNINGVNIHTARKNMGRLLKKTHILKQISSSVCLIHRFLQPQVLQKNQGSLTRWAWLKTSTSNAPSSSPPRNCVNKAFG